jgi:glyoxylase I family protein
MITVRIRRPPPRYRSEHSGRPGHEARSYAAAGALDGCPNFRPYRCSIPKTTGRQKERKPVKLKLHHLNLCTTNVPAMNEFYRSVLDLAPEPAMNAMRIRNQGYGGEVAFVTDGTTQLHLSEKDLGCGFRTGNVINPVERGHIAFRTDDIDAFKRRLDDKGIPYSDYGGWAMQGWRQIFFYDPDGNVVEVHQAPD